MKVGILTFQFPYNYGAMLQAYALKSYIEKKETKHMFSLIFLCIFNKDIQ